MQTPSRHDASLRKIQEFLTPYYTLPRTSGGHDLLHIKRMIAMGPKIQSAIPGFELPEYIAAVWLHNMDRSPELKQQMEAAGGFESYCHVLLYGTTFPGISRHRIAIAAREHSKKYNSPGDSPLLVALRTADMIDRFGAIGALEVAAHRGAELPIYNEGQMFGVIYFEQNDESQLQTLYHDHLRVISWYQGLTDAGRNLVPQKNFRFLIAFTRQLAEEVAEITGAENKVENDLQAALGIYYEAYA